MGFVIPSSRKKLYLSGADWVINVLDYILKSETCAGNMSQVVMELEGTPDRYLLKSHLQKFINEFPVLHGTISRDLNLAPYWKIPADKEFPLNFNYYDLEDLPGKDGLSVLSAAINKKFKGEQNHLAFQLISKGNEKSCFAMTFDHRTFDGRGAEIFLDLFEKFMSDNSAVSADDFNFTAPANLDKWIDKFYAGREVNRKMVALSERSTASLPVPPGKNKAFQFRTIRFNAEESRRIEEDVSARAGYLMETPYLLSVVSGAFSELFKSRGLNSEVFLVPVSVDMRKGDNILDELFFNHVSYLFYQIPIEHTGAVDKTIPIIRNQMYEQIKSGLPGSIIEASLLTRIAPPGLLKKIFTIPVEGKIASFCFSHVGKSSYQHSRFMGLNVTNIFHMPRVPVPPGFGLFFNKYGECLNLVISYLEGLIDENELKGLESAIKGKLLS